MPQLTTAGNRVDDLVLYTATGLAASTSGDSMPGFGEYKLLIFQLSTDNTSGTTPTSNVRIQDSIDRGTTWHDIVSFAQVTETTGAEIQDARVSAFVVPNPATAAQADGTLAAGSVRQGPFGGLLRAKVTLGGTNPVYDITVKISAQK